MGRAYHRRGADEPSRFLGGFASGPVFVPCAGSSFWIEIGADGPGLCMGAVQGVLWACYQALQALDGRDDLVSRASIGRFEPGYADPELVGRYRPAQRGLSS